MTNLNEEYNVDLGEMLLSAFTTMGTGTIGGGEAASRYMRRSTLTRPFAPDCDIIQNENEMIIYLSLPGVDKSSINIEFQNNKVIVSGEKNKPYTNEGYTIKSSQIYYGRFNKTVRIPIVVTNPESVVRTFEDGLLTIKILFNVERENFFSLGIE